MHFATALTSVILAAKTHAAALEAEDWLSNYES